MLTCRILSWHNILCWCRQRMEAEQISTLSIFIIINLSQIKVCSKWKRRSVGYPWWKVESVTYTQCVWPTILSLFKAPMRLNIPSFLLLYFQYFVLLLYYWYVVTINDKDLTQRPYGISHLVKCHDTKWQSCVAAWFEISELPCCAHGCLVLCWQH